MASDLIGQGLELMLVGMGTVFVFLTVLVLATSGMSWLALRYFPEEQQASGQAQSGVTLEEVAAITAAIDRHRQR
jgi:oxaloacetate decarboxylase gamma subunit